jgi:hypothetical protein
MVAFDSKEPVAVSIGCKRPPYTLVHRIAVHPEHLRKGHGRHLLTSLSAKLAILGPPHLVAEVAAGNTAARALFRACGWTEARTYVDFASASPVASPAPSALSVALVGAVAGMMGGATADLDNARIGADFIDDVNAELLPNRVALVAEIDEEWATPVDTRMEAIGGTVFRRALSEVSDTVNREEADAMKADLAQLKAEHSKARADRKAKLQEKINQLDSKIQAWSQKDKDRTEAVKRQVKAKLQVLKEKATGQRAKAS